MVQPTLCIYKQCQPKSTINNMDHNHTQPNIINHTETLTNNTHKHTLKTFHKHKLTQIPLNLNQTLNIN